VTTSTTSHRPDAKGIAVPQPEDLRDVHGPVVVLREGDRGEGGVVAGGGASPLDVRGLVVRAIYLRDVEQYPIQSERCRPSKMPAHYASCTARIVVSADVAEEMAAAAAVGEAIDRER